MPQEQSDRERRACPDCGVQPGQLHLLGCDIERCRLCGSQRASCQCPMDDGVTEDDFGGRLPWTGTWPGEAECQEYGLIFAGTDIPDLNRLVMECDWSPGQGRWLKRA